MPIFTYKCSKCEKIFEEIVGVISEEEELKCPECGSKEVDKQLSSFSVGKTSETSSVSSCPTCNLD
ncbi:MAG: FmdB family zinc ribbon protein [Elusimicrobiota bacterium]